jgi:hypothetical protein
MWPARRRTPDMVAALTGQGAGQVLGGIAAGQPAQHEDTGRLVGGSMGGVLCATCRRLQASAPVGRALCLKLGAVRNTIACVCGWGPGVAAVQQDASCACAPCDNDGPWSEHAHGKVRHCYMGQLPAPGRHAMLICTQIIRCATGICREKAALLSISNLSVQRPRARPNTIVQAAATAPEQMQTCQPQ